MRFFAYYTTLTLFGNRFRIVSPDDADFADALRRRGHRRRERNTNVFARYVPTPRTQTPRPPPVKRERAHSEQKKEKSAYARCKGRDRT